MSECKCSCNPSCGCKCHKKRTWIKCSERMPENGGRYLVYNQKGSHMHNCLAYNYPYPCCKPNIAYYNDLWTGWRWESGNDDIPVVTHWMPLPNPPEKS